MTRKLAARFACAVAATLTTMFASANPSIAAGNIGPPAPPDNALDVPAGLACGFELLIEFWDPTHRVFKEFKDKNGNVVRQLTAGAGTTLRFTNLSNSSNPKVLLVATGGSVEHKKLNTDGSQQWTVTGHNVLILFPTDVPHGPSTVLYVGKLVFTISPLGVFTVQSFSGGTPTDICAALSI